MTDSISTAEPIPIPTPTTTTVVDNTSASTATTFAPPLPSPFQNTHPPPTLLTQGAEALIYRTHHITAPSPVPTNPSTNTTTNEHANSNRSDRGDSVAACLKFRPSKSYRHPTLDARLTKQRVLAEARVLVKLSGSELRAAGVRVPALLALEWDVARKTKNAHTRSLGVRSGDGGGGGVRGGAWLLMEWIEGRSVKEVIRECDGWMRRNSDRTEELAKVEEGCKEQLRSIGRAIGVMHDRGGVVHGDLTSSNVMLRPLTHSRDGAVHGEDRYSQSQLQSQSRSAPQTQTQFPQNGDELAPPDTTGEIVLIDFGLATQSVQDEDRAVDLYVLERAFGSTHPRQEGWFEAEVLLHEDGYRGSFKGAKVVLRRLEEVRARGRKRTMIG